MCLAPGSYDVVFRAKGKIFACFMFWNNVIKNGPVCATREDAEAVQMRETEARALLEFVVIFPVLFCY